MDRLRLARVTGWAVGLLTAVLALYFVAYLLGWVEGDLFLLSIAVFCTFGGMREAYLAPEVVRLRSAAQFRPWWLVGVSDPSDVRRIGRRFLRIGLLGWVVVLLEVFVLR